MPIPEARRRSIEFHLGHQPRRIITDVEVERAALAIRNDEAGEHGYDPVDNLDVCEGAEHYRRIARVALEAARV